MSTWNLNSAVTAVSGAASGIGLATCLRLRKEGGTPILLDWDAERLEKALEEVYPEFSDRAKYGYQVDVRDSKAIDTIFDEIAKTHGQLTHAVACAGFVGPADILTITDEQWHRVIDVNLNGTLYFCRAAAKQLAAGRAGAIVTIASVAGLSAREARVAYTASKAAVINLTRALALDLGPHGVRVNGIAPGVTDTPMQSHNREKNAKASESIALRRIGTPDEIANVILFLLSDFASYVTGETILVDGGLMAKYR